MLNAKKFLLKGERERIYFSLFPQPLLPLNTYPFTWGNRLPGANAVKMGIVYLLTSNLASPFFTHTVTSSLS
jgi:hypothetical protein